MKLFTYFLCSLACVVVLIRGEKSSSSISRVDVNSGADQSLKWKFKSSLKLHSHDIPKAAATLTASASTFASSAVSSTMKKIPVKTKKLEFLSIFLPWLYFLCTSMNVSTLPGYINSVLSAKGEEKVSQLGVKVYGNLQGFDAFFTFLSVNLVGCLSDVFGRKPFLFLASLGLGTAYALHSIAFNPLHFYLASSIDGLTSCMLSQSQSFITDLTGEETNLGIALSRFQGLAIGMAFLIGIPLGQVLSKMFGRVTPLRASFAICMLNCFLIMWLLPAHLQPPAATTSPEEPLSTSDKNEEKPKLSLIQKLKTVPWHQANPMGAAWILTKTNKLFLASLAYFCINLAQCGVQATWINYLGHKFNMSAQQAGSTLLLVGIMMAVIPPFAIPALGIARAICLSLLLYSISLIMLSLANSPVQVFIGMPFLAAGASAIPMILGYMTQQANAGEVGALQGAADTVRTVANMVGSPLFAEVFSRCMAETVQRPHWTLRIISTASFAALLLFLVLIGTNNNPDADRVQVSS